MEVPLARLAHGLVMVLVGCRPATQEVAVAPSVQATPSAVVMAIPAVEGDWLGAFEGMRVLTEQASFSEALGEIDRAAVLYERAAAHGANVPARSGRELLLRAAENHAKSGRERDALRTLAALADRGFHGSELLRTTPAFAGLLAHPEFQATLQRVHDNFRVYKARHSDPETAALVFDDVPRFWEAYDRAAKLTSRDSKVSAYRRFYLAPGTRGLIDYHWLKTDSVERLVEMIEAAPGYYAGIRERTLEAAHYAPQIREGFRRLAALYPEAHFPPTTFVVGRLNSGGTAGEEGMLIGLDIWSYLPGVPLDGVAPALQPLIARMRLDDLPVVVLHEQIHAMQQYGGEQSLLRDVLMEGAADFLAHLALPDRPQMPYYEWGLEHEDRVWAKFELQMRDGEYGDWIANYSGELLEADWHPDLGYFVGARICEAYYDRASDKRQAIRDLLFVNDPFAILEASGYPEHRLGGRSQ